MHDRNAVRTIATAERAAWKIQADDRSVGIGQPAKHKEGAAIAGADFHDRLRTPLADKSAELKEFATQLQWSNNLATENEFHQGFRAEATTTQNSLAQERSE